MNERIRELLTPKLKEWGGASGDNFSEELEKFAELIVRECEKVIRDEIAVTDIDGEVDKAWEMGMECGVYTIKEHFGFDSEDEVEYCPRCNAEWSGTSCGLDNCGWIVGVEE